MDWISVKSLLEDSEKEEKLTLSVLRKKHKGKRVDLEKVPRNECFYNAQTLQLDWEFTYFRDWNGEELSYEVVIRLNPDMTICKIEPLHCCRYVGSDATWEGYRNKRADDFDYWLLDCRIEKILAD